MSTFPIEAVGALSVVDAQALSGPAAVAAGPAGGFEKLLLDGIARVDGKLQAADALATAFTVDDSIPPHQVMFALEDARLSFELMLQVRSRLVEGYQELMRMQL
jgi:flagellar hook-basal body complex protein FliE